VLAIVIALGTASLQADPAGAGTAFERGLELARAGQFPEAAAAFEASAKAQPAAGTYVNLGLAQWQSGRAGLAILAWEQAKWINPYDRRAQANLDFARQATFIDPPRLKWFESVSTWLPPNAWPRLTGATLWLALGLLILPSVFRRPKRGWHQFVAALAFSAFLVSITGDAGAISRTHLGVIIRKNAVLQLTPTRSGEEVSTLNAGEPVRALRRHGDYVYVQGLGTAGWLDRSAMGLICPE
jgi:tetratricopeptide (TPR) repeat protein